MLDRELFELREENGLRLIYPSHGGAVGNAPWTRDTLQYRSRVETLEGDTVSAGFTKFFNLGTGPTDLQIGVEDVAAACERGDAVATLKIDGSLLIRSVYKGRVLLRTRGSFGYEHLDNAAEMGLFQTKYPELFNPDLWTGWSLLFEWVSPQNVIVLKYPEPELTLIGAVCHTDMSYMMLSSLSIIADHLQIPLVKSFKLDKAGWGTLQKELETNTDIEGYVIRIGGEQRLVKVKAIPYLTKHALKSTLSTEKLADMYFQQGRPSFQEFVKSFSEAFDEETCLWAYGAIAALFDGVKVLGKIEDHMRASVQKRKGWTRKDSALIGLSEYGQTKRFSLYMNLWEGKPIKTELLKSVLLQNTKQVELGTFK